MSASILPVNYDHCITHVCQAYHKYSIADLASQGNEPFDFLNRPFVGSGHVVRNKLRWDANNAVGISKQRKVGLDW